MPIRSDTAHYMGTGIPPHTGGFGSRLGLGNLQVFATGQWAAGHVITNRTRANMIRARTGEEYFSAVIENKDNPITPKTDPVKALFAKAAIVGEYTEPGDWLRVRELGLSYSLPRRWSSVFGSEGAKLSVTGRNLYTMTKYSGPDPEVAATLVTPASDNFVPGNRQFATTAVGNDLYTVPQPRQVVVGFDVQF
jgi:TonB-dependent starch-binding outer membrane protein SusC